MPELPDVTVYVEALEARIRGEVIERIRIASPFVLRSFDPPIGAAEGKRVAGVRRLGKRIVVALEGELYLVLHLMIAGRLRWKEGRAAVPGKVGLAAFEFSSGTLLFVESATKKRASLHLVRGDAALASFDRGGLEVLDATEAEFAAVLSRESHTLKRALTDPTLFSGIGNAYSDEILHRARMSPFALTRSLDGGEIARLREAVRGVLGEWTDRLRAEAAGRFPEKVTAFREGMAVHGRHGEPCPDCGSAVQRILYAENESNYCPRCQTGGKLLADRGLSRLMRGDWPKTLEELEERKRENRR